MAMRPLDESHPISQRFSDNSTIYNVGAGHGAIDIAAPVGSVVVAPEDSIVMFDGWSWDLPGGPNDWALRWYLIKGAPGDTKAGGGIITVLRNSAGSHWGIAHASKSYFNAGDRVRKGQRIQLSGVTGIATGPHSHVNLWPKHPNWANGYFGAIDPLPWLNERYAPLVPGQPPKTTPNRVLNGVDVSAYQPANIVSRVPNDFVIVKVTEGTGWVSPVFRQQLAEARRLGKKVGVYHFARPLVSDSNREAEHFVKTTRAAGIPDRDLFWVLDWEEEKAYAYTQWARDFMARVDTLTGTRCGLYANTQGLTGGVWSAKDKDRPVWRAYPVLSGTGYATSFHLPPLPPGWANLVMDQYSFFGRLPGYGADLDLNVYYGGLPQWGATGGSAASQSAAPAPTDALEELLTMSQAQFNKDKKRAGTPAWYLTNDRDRGVNIEKRLRHMEWIADNDRDRGINNEKRLVNLEKKIDAVLAALTEGK